jgi:prolyl oligopeptidase
MTKENYHGTWVDDPYRSLEDLESESTRHWIQAQNEKTFDYLKQIPQREGIRKRLKSLWNYPKWGTPWKRGSFYFFTKNDGLQNQSVLYVQDGLHGTPRMLLDPNTFSEQGTASLGHLEISAHGRYVLYGVSQSGSDWQTLHICEVETGKILEDRISWNKFSPPTWDPQELGFFYCRYDSPQKEKTYQEINKKMRLYYHRLGTPVESDPLLYERPDEPEFGFFPEISSDGQYLVLSLWKGTDPRNDLYYKDLSTLNGSPTSFSPLFNHFDSAYEYIGSIGKRWFFLTDKEAAHKKIVEVHLDQPQPEHWIERIPESEVVLVSAHLFQQQIVLKVLDNVKTRLFCATLEGKPLHEITLPTLGSVDCIRGEWDSTEMFYDFTSFTYPTTIYRYDFQTQHSEVFQQPQIPFDLDAYEVRQVFYRSKDDTEIPMFLIHQKGMQQTGEQLTYLYSYGGFNISMTPHFSVSYLVWLERGGIVAIPNIRGGGEYGERWHQSGMREKKQNVFDDFIAGAEYLIDEKYCSPSTLAIAGGSNGGLLVGACITQRPELFGAAILAVGVLDMLRFHKFTIGWAWVPEYGSAEKPEEFSYLYAYSPLHQIKAGTCYPSTLLLTGDHDDRVVPSHSFKFAATLQPAHRGENPILIRIETQGGHGAGKPTDKLIEEQVDKWAFLLKNLKQRSPYTSLSR